MMVAADAERIAELDRPGGRHELALAAGIVAILFVILVPLPPAVMDALLIVNVTGSFVVLMTTAYVKRPVDFSVFPSLLLVVTFFRLALNVATTRLILGNAQDAGLGAAGGVVAAFASFVAGSNVVVGLVVFFILVVVQFVVITRGTTRISEVAARFTLDAMPGKQLSIDGDFAAGLISGTEVRRRRADLEHETDFFGAMDGASKFVRGEAVASLLITATNIIGGFFLGAFYHGMSIPTAADVFAKLTVGDGLVSQIPALMVSVGTALLITKNSGGDGLGGDVRRQILGNHRIFYVAAAFLLFLLPSGIPKLWLLAGAVVSLGIGLSLRGETTEGDPATFRHEPAEVPLKPVEESSHEKVRNLLLLEPIELEIGYRLVGLVDEERGGDLMARLSRVRERVALDLGLVVPPVKVRDNTRLHPGEYCVRLRGNAVGHWRVYPSKVLVITEGESLSLDGIPGADPATGSEGTWVVEAEAAVAARNGFVVRRVGEILTEHIEKLVRLHASEILTREEVSRLIADLRERAPALVDELIPGTLKIGDIHKVLQNLLREQVSIRNLELIIESLADCGERLRDPGELTEHVRVALARTICSRLATRDGVLHAVLLDPALEEFLQTSVENTEKGGGMAIEPEVAETLVESVEGTLRGLETLKLPPVLVCSGLIRTHLRSLIVRRLPAAAVLAYEEVADDFRLQVHGTVALQKVS